MTILDLKTVFLVFVFPGRRVSAKLSIHKTAILNWSDFQMDYRKRWELSVLVVLSRRFG